MFSSGNDIISCPGCGIPVSTGQPRSECFNCAANAPSSRSPATRWPLLRRPDNDDGLAPTRRITAAVETCSSSPSSYAGVDMALSSSPSSVDDPPPAYSSFRPFGTQIPPLSSSVGRTSCDRSWTGTTDADTIMGDLGVGPRNGYGAMGTVNASGAGSVVNGETRESECMSSKSNSQSSMSREKGNRMLKVLALGLILVLIIIAVVSVALTFRPESQEMPQSDSMP